MQITKISDNQELSLTKQLYDVSKEWAFLNKQASLLEETRKIIFAEIQNRLREEQVKENIKIVESKIESLAMVSIDYKSHIDRMIDARYKTNLKRAELEKVKNEIEDFKRQEINNAIIRREANYTGFGG